MSFLENLNWRYATKIFNNQKVGVEQLGKIKEAIRLSPSSFGSQPYHVIILPQGELVAELSKHSEHNEVRLNTCSHLLIFCARTDLDNRFAGIEKLQNRKNHFLSRVGLAFNYFMPFVYWYEFRRVFTKYAWATAQAYIALGYATAACAELQIDSSPMEGFDASAYSKILSLPKHVKPVVILAIGFRDATDIVYPKARFSEQDIFTDLS